MLIHLEDIEIEPIEGRSNAFKLKINKEKNFFLFFTDKMVNFFI